jgi:hypothetical protein
MFCRKFEGKIGACSATGHAPYGLGATMGDEIRPFKIHVSEADLEDLKKRLRATRWPEPRTVSD